MANAPTPQQRKVTALEKAIGAGRQSQADAKAAGQTVKSTVPAPPPTARP